MSARAAAGAVGITVVLLALFVSLPLFVIDSLLAASLSASVLLLVTSLVSASRVRPVLPSLLVGSTLVRVALLLAAVRAMLTAGTASPLLLSIGGVSRVQISTAIGVFTLVLFAHAMVLSRGVERIAEVSARFALDAMPGRQLAIDGDVRSAAIDPQRATERRATLEHESAWFASLDGATRFLRGETWLVVVVVLVAFVLRAVTAFSTSSPLASVLRAAGASAALGIATLVPASLVAAATSLQLSTTSPTNNEPPTRWSTALAVTAAIVTVVALAASLPWLPVATSVAVILGLAGLAARNLSPQRSDNRLFVRCTAVSLTTLRLDRDALLQSVRSAWNVATGGLPNVPTIDVELASADAPRFELVHDGIVHATHQPTTTNALETWLHDTLTPIARDAINVDVAAAVLRSVSSTSPELARTLVPTTMTLARFASLLRALIEERVPPRPATAIATALTHEANPKATLEQQLLLARRALRATISTTLAHSSPLHVQRLGDEATLAIRDELQRGTRSRSLQADLVAALDSIGGKGSVVLLCEGDVRRRAWELLSPSHPTVTVLAVDELNADVVLAIDGTLGP